MFYTCTPHPRAYMLWTLYHGALRFVTNLKAFTHHCLLYEGVGWSSLSSRKLVHWLIVTYKAILGLLPVCLLTYIKQKSTGDFNLLSQDLFLLSVPKVRSELGKKVFKFAAPFTRNKLQKDLKRNELVLFDIFKRMLNDMEEGASAWFIFLRQLSVLTSICCFSLLFHVF